MLTEPNSAASRIAHHGRNVKENDNSATENLQIFFIIRQVWTAGLFFRRDFARNAVDKEASGVRLDQPDRHKADTGTRLI